MTIDTTTRVLIIDDDEEALVLLTALLGQIPSADFRVDHASTFAEGEEAIARSEHDVYLVDYHLGEDSGIDLVREARADGNRAPMILVTGKGRYETDLEAMVAGVSDYLDKASLDLDIVERSIRYSLERARSEEALRESESRHRSMFDNLPIGLYRVSMDGELLDANPSLTQLLGRPDRDTLEFVYSRNFFVNHAHRQAFLSRLEQFGVVRGFESHLARPDGRVVRIRNAARAHRDHDGTPLYVEGAVEDVSEEHESKDLQSRAARFQWVFHGSGLGVLLLDLHGTILDGNPAFLRAFGYDLADLRGRRLTELSDGAAVDDLTREIARVASGETDFSEAKRGLKASNMGVLWVHIRIGLVRSAKGYPDHLIALL